MFEASCRHSSAPKSTVRKSLGMCILAIVLGLCAFGPKIPSDGNAADPPASGKTSGNGSGKEPSIDGIPLFSTWPQNQKPDAAIVLSGETFGFFQPCGCSRPQKGGLERRAQFMLTLKAKGWPVAGVDLGDMYPESIAVRDQGLLKYKFMMNALREMGYIAIGVGKNEFKVEIDRILGQYALQKLQPPFTLAANLIGMAGGKPQQREVRFQVPGANRPMVEDAEVANVGTVSVGVVGIVGKSARKEIADANYDTSISFREDTGALLTEIVQKLAANPKKPELHILLYQGSVVEAKKLAQDLPQFQVILCLADDSEPPQYPIEVGGKLHPAGQRTLVIQVGHKGRYVGVIGAFKRLGGGIDLKYQLVPLGEEYITPGTEPEALKTNPVLPVLENYARQVKEWNFTAEVPRVQHPAQILEPKLNLTFVGSAKCQNCHAAEFVKWQGTHHSHAFNALVKVAKRPSLREYDAECIVCHTVGFGYKTGYEDQIKTPQLLHVGCESCHGPGSGHAADPKNKVLLALQSPWKQTIEEKLPNLAFMKKMAELNGIERGQQKIAPATLRLINKTSEMCQRCHNHENDPNFDLYTNWPKIHHTAPPKN
ncbi:MAG TPA: multiheme c-type cytochrome [Gemmata sp.]|nr:multiheme c-type cytochrome [Gemmata sp.]